MDKIPLTLRIDADIHEKIREMAFKERRSINNIINYIIREYLKEKDGK